MFTDDRYRMETEAAALLRGDDAKKVLTALRGLLDAGAVPGEDAVLAAAAPGAVSREPFAALIRRIGEQTGLKGKSIYLPIRAAVTGRLHGPELDRIFPLLGRISLLRRIDKALALT